MAESDPGLIETRERIQDRLRKYLMQLQCTEHNWKESKVPESLVAYIVGDLLPVIRDCVYLEDQRVLITLNVDESELPGVQDRMVAYQAHAVNLAGVTCKFTFSWVGAYEDLVQIMTNVEMYGCDGSISPSDIVHGYEPLTEPPAFQYLSLRPDSSSTPEKDWKYWYNQVWETIAKMPERAKQQLKVDLGIPPGKVEPPNLGESPKPIVKPKVTTSSSSSSPHISRINEPTLHESVVHATSLLVQEMVGKGILKGNTPKLEPFHGDPQAKQTPFAMWERRVLSFDGQYTDTAIKEAMQLSLKGRAAQDLDTLAPDATWKEILEVLRTKYQNKASCDALLTAFYNLKMTDEDDLASFSTKLEQQLKHVLNNFPEKLATKDYWSLLKERFFHGVPSHIRTNIRNLFDLPGTSYYQLLSAARRIEGESSMVETKDKGHEEEKSSKANKSKNQPRVSAVQIGSEHDFKKLEKAFSQTSTEVQSMQQTLKDITKALGKLQQQQPTTSSNHTQNNEGDGVTTHSNPNYNNSRGRGRWRGGGRFNRGRGFGRGYGSPKPILCYWCRDHVSAEEAQHPIQNCPFYSKCKTQWWSNVQAQDSTNNTSSNQEN